MCPHFGARVEKAAAAGAPVEFVIPEEGGLSFIWNTSILAGRPKDSTELAEKFVATTFDPEQQIAFARQHGYPPTNLKAMKNLPNDLKKLELSEAQVGGVRQDPAQLRLHGDVRVPGPDQGPLEQGGSWGS